MSDRKQVCSGPGHWRAASVRAVCLLVSGACIDFRLLWAGATDHWLCADAGW